MKRIITSSILILLSLALLVGCCYTLFDKPQTYHAGYEELEHVINDELGDYLSIVSYENPMDMSTRESIEDHLIIHVYLRSSYLDSLENNDAPPIWFVVDRFRCLANAFFYKNPNYFGEEILYYEFVFCKDEGDHIDDEIAYLANYVSRYPDISEYYDCLVEERCIGEIDFSQIDNRDELVSLWIPYVGDIETPSENEYFEYLCGVIEMFPNLKYYHLIYTPFSQDVRDSLVSRINDRYSNISEI